MDHRFRWWRVVCHLPGQQFTAEMDVCATTEQIAINTLQIHLEGYLGREEDVRPYMRASELDDAPLAR